MQSLSGLAAFQRAILLGFRSSANLSLLKVFNQSKVSAICLHARRSISFGLLVDPHQKCVLSPKIRHGSTKISGGKIKYENENDQHKIKTIPNLLCLFRIGLTPLIGYLILCKSFTAATGLFATAALTDLLDGYVARNFRGQKSALGSLIDPLADKILISTVFLTLSYVHLIPVMLTALVVFRDLSLIIGALILRLRHMDPPKTLPRFFNPSVSSIKARPTFASKLNTALQISVVTASLLSPIFGFVEHPLLTTLFFINAGTTIYSGIQYATSSRIERTK